MRLAHFVHAFPERTETFISRQVDGLCARGHRVDVFTHRAPRHTDPDTGGEARILSIDALRSAGSDGAGRWLRRGAAAAATVALQPRVAAGWLARSGMGLRRGVETLVRAPLLAREGPYDVVHCHYGDIGLADGGAAAYWSAPLIVSFYGYDCSSYVAARGRDVFLPLFAAADRVLVLGESMRARLLALGAPPDRIGIQPLGVDTDRIRPSATPPEAGRVVTVARLVPKKGIDLALRSVTRVAAEGIDIRYEILGDGPLRGSLEALAATLGIDDRVRFRGLCSQAEVAEALARAAVFLLPSRTAPDGDEEGTPTVLLEAASAGVPVVSTRHAGIPDIVAHGETGVLVPEGDDAGLAEAVAGLLAGSARREAMARAARDRAVREHDVKALDQRLERHYEEASAHSARIRSHNGPRPASRRA